jgi:CheY-like chemotaxis protein
MRILLVDDDSVFHFIHKKILNSIGFTEIATANNGEEALGLIDENVSKSKPLPNVIFVDLDMPVLDGFGFIKAFKDLIIPHKEKIHIAILSSSFSPIDRTRAAELGVSTYLSKPISENTIQSLLKSFAAG